MKFIDNTYDLEKYLFIKIKKHNLIKSISTDTRSIVKKSMFIALRGNNFNGNDYIEEALKKGAVIVLTDDKRFLNSKNKKIIYVKNTILALGKISRNIIKEFK